VKILFFGRHFTYFRNFESVFAAGRARATDHLACGPRRVDRRLQLVQTLAATLPNSRTARPAARADDNAWVANHLRLGLDYLRYQHRIFDNAPTLAPRARIAHRRSSSRWADRADDSASRHGGCFAASSGRFERYVPEDPPIGDYITSHAPDVF
jgi:hypothetical protein